MTVIVGISDGKRAVIAADSQWTIHGSVKGHPRDEKIGRSSKFLVGFAGSASAARPLLRWASECTYDIDEMRDRCRGDVRRILEDEGAKPEADEVWPAYATSGIFVYPQGILHMDGCGAVTGPLQYWAIGNGAEYALGVAHSHLDGKSLFYIDQIAVSAVRAAIHFDVYCGGEVHFMEMRAE